MTDRELLGIQIYEENQRNGANAIGRYEAQQHGPTDCSETRLSFVLCTHAQSNFGGGGTTFGSIFVTKAYTVPPSVRSHEMVHSWQWAKAGPANFIPGYIGASIYSWFATGDAACQNVLEEQAGLTAGNYSECKSINKGFYGGPNPRPAPGA
jgi:hypothetical protein